MLHFIHTITLPPTNPKGLFGSTPYFLPYCFTQPSLITSVKEQGNGDMCLHVMTEKLFQEWTTLCAGHVVIPFLTPLFQHSKWSTSPAHGCQGQDIHHPVRTGERERACQTNGTALCPDQQASKESESADKTHSSK